MSNLDLDTHSINLKCPKCSRIIPKSIEFLKSCLTVACTTCGENFDIQVDELNKGIERVEMRIRDLTDALKTLNKK